MKYSISHHYSYVESVDIEANSVEEAMEKFATDDSLKWYESMPLTLMERTLEVLNEEEDEYETLYTWG